MGRLRPKEKRLSPVAQLLFPMDACREQSEQAEASALWAVKLGLPGSLKGLWPQEVPGECPLSSQRAGDWGGGWGPCQSPKAGCRSCPERNISAAGSERGDMGSLSRPSPAALASLAGQDFVHSLTWVIYGCHEAASGCRAQEGMCGGQSGLQVRPKDGLPQRAVGQMLGTRQDADLQLLTALHLGRKQMCECPGRHGVSPAGCQAIASLGLS